jgi:glycosyltransferase involved in cell wall biosynthesis
MLGSLSSDKFDEGMRNVAYHLMQELGQHHTILGLDPSNCTSYSFWQQIKSFRPEIIHYTSGPTIRSLLLLKLLKMCCPKAKTVVSALHPWIRDHSKFFIRFMKPDLVLVQSERIDSLFSRNGCQTRFLPNGVDTTRFKPQNAMLKAEIRRSLSISEEMFIILHVGPIKEGRGLKELIPLQFSDQQVLIIGSLTAGYDKATLELLQGSGCIIWRKYFDDIENIYLMSDCYVFPTRDPLHSIEMPLSVLEAMSCNLPVISTSFGGLPTFFQPGDGLFFHQTTEEMIQNLKNIRAGMSIQTRKKVQGLSWARIVNQLEDIYASMMQMEKQHAKSQIAGMGKR